MKICIAGAGAIGGTLGARLALAGHQVSLLARGAHLDALRRQGLRFTASDGTRHHLELPSANDPAEFGSQDVIIIAVKAHTIGALLPQLNPLLTPQTMIVPAINGLPWWYFHGVQGPLQDTALRCLDPQQRLFDDLDPRQIVGCVVHAAGEVPEPGSVHETSAGAYILGEPDNRPAADSPRLRQLASCFTKAGINAPLSDAIRNDIWVKLLGNLVFNPLGALTGGRLDAMAASTALHPTVVAMMREGMAVGEAYGAVFDIDIEQRLAMARAVGPVKVSMAQDLERSRTMEIEPIIGAVVELARRAGLKTPVIDTVYAIIRELERQRLG